MSDTSFDQLNSLARVGNIEEVVHRLGCTPTATRQDVDLAIALGEAMLARDQLDELVVLLDALMKHHQASRLLALRGLARLGLGHFQPSAADLECGLATSASWSPDERNRAFDGLLAALLALSRVRSGCPLYERKAELIEALGVAGICAAGTPQMWLAGEWKPGRSFANVAFGDQLPDELLCCIRVVPDDREERWCMSRHRNLVVATDHGRLDLVQTSYAVTFHGKNLIGRSEDELAQLLGLADEIERIGGDRYLVFDRHDVDFVVSGDTTVRAILTGDG